MLGIQRSRHFPDFVAQLSGSVERLFSISGTVIKAQYALRDTIRRMRLMAQYNGDVEGRNI